MTETNITPIAHKPPIVVLREKLQERRPELQAALTDIDPDHFIRALITAAQINPELRPTVSRASGSPACAPAGIISCRTAAKVPSCRSSRTPNGFRCTRDFSRSFGPAVSASGSPPTWSARARNFRIGSIRTANISGMFPASVMVWRRSNGLRCRADQRWRVLCRRDDHGRNQQDQGRCRARHEKIARGGNGRMK